MNLIEARNAIEAILASIDAGALPKPYKVKNDSEHGPIVYTDKSHGFYITSGRDGNGRPIVTDYRSRGSWDAVEAEIVHRATLKHYAKHPLTEAAS